MQTNKKALFKKGDSVQVMTGRDRGRVAQVLKIDVQQARVWVEGVCQVKRHQKAKSSQQSGGIVVKEASIHQSNLLLYCQKCSRGVRYGHRLQSQADRRSKVRFCRKCNEVLDQKKEVAHQE